LRWLLRIRRSADWVFGIKNVVPIEERNNSRTRTDVNGESRSFQGP
jgi:hypothetical protein